MRPSTLRVVGVTIFLMLCSAVVGAQQSVNETRIDQIRATVQKLEGLAGDTNVPAETRAQLSDLLFEKRGELHALLRQKRDALRSSLRANMSAEEADTVNNAIQQLSQELEQLKRNSTTVSESNGHSEPQNGGGGSDGAPPLDARETTPTAEATTPSVSAVLGTPASLEAAPRSPQPAVAQPDATQPVAAQDPCVGLGSGGGTPEVEYQNQITNAACRMFRARNGRGNRADAQLNFNTYNFLMLLAIPNSKIAKVAVPALTAQAEDASHSKNLTAGESSSGGTSLVAKAGVPAILGFATESGGLTSTTNGSTVTFTGNPVGLVQAMAKKGFISGFQDQDDFTKFLRKFSFGLSFDTSRGAQPGTFTGNKQQLSGFSFKYNIVDQRDPRDSRHTARWQSITSKQATNLALATNNFVIGLVTGPGVPQLNAWLASANKELEGATDFSDIRSRLTAELNKLGDVELPLEQEALVEQVGTNFEAFLKERNDILDEISNGWIATLDYTNTRPVGTPSLSNFRFLAEKGAYKGSLDFTGNASVTIYNSRPTGPKPQTLRDFRFAGQLDVPIGDVTKTGKFLISLAGRYQRLLEDEPILGSTLVVPKGDIATFQAKLTIPIRGTAFKIPLSFSYANRTELIKERELRGNFGFTFDLDSIFAKFNPFTKN